MSAFIQLTYADIIQASTIGVLRQVENLKKNRKPAYGAGEENHWQIHLEGCLGELSVAKYTGQYWNGKGILGAPDVGDNTDVRTTERGSHLLLHHEDKDEREFWLVIGQYGKYELAGWITGQDAKQDRYWGDKANKGRPCFWIPRDVLHSPEERENSDRLSLKSVG